MQTVDREQLTCAIEQLEEKGLNLFSILRVGRLGSAVKKSLTDLALPYSDSNRIILIGNGGSSLWQSLPPAIWDHNDPIDSFSHAAAQQFARKILGEDRYQVIYPGTHPVALQQMGLAAGWHANSPLGLGINPRWGLWFAYRAAILTRIPLPEIRHPKAASPCVSCQDQPCISHCPAQALTADRAIDMPRCGNYRLNEDSRCSDRCLARISCPVSIEHRYTLEQIRYHYRLSLETLRHYYGGMGGRAGR